MDYLKWGTNVGIIFTSFKVMHSTMLYLLAPCWSSAICSLYI